MFAIGWQNLAFDESKRRKVSFMEHFDGKIGNFKKVTIFFCHQNKEDIKKHSSNSFITFYMFAANTKKGRLVMLQTPVNLHF